MPVNSNTIIYKCWSSAKARNTFFGSVDEFIEIVGEYPGYGMELHRINKEEPISESNFKWILPRPKDEMIMDCVKEGYHADAGTICPYKMADVGKRTAWLAGHYDAYGENAWISAGGGSPTKGGAATTRQ